MLVLLMLLSKRLIWDCSLFTKIFGWLVLVRILRKGESYHFVRKVDFKGAVVRNNCALGMSE